MRSALLLSVFLLSGCSAFPVPEPPPQLQNRSLRISKDLPGFEYNYEVCVRKNIFGGCKESQWQKDVYDLTDPIVRQKLIDIGFIGKVREKLK